jgi:hypothetical protein
MIKFTCPVCGYNNLPDPPVDYEICPSCGTEFGYDDFTFSHENLRRKWLTAGAKWHSRRISPPANWNPYQQLLNAGEGYEKTAPDGEPTVVDLEATQQTIAEGVTAHDRIIAIGTVDVEILNRIHYATV